MTAKKEKDLALELLDDLLEDAPPSGVSPTQGATEIVVSATNTPTADEGPKAEVSPPESTRTERLHGTGTLHSLLSHAGQPTPPNDRSRIPSTAPATALHLSHSETLRLAQQKIIDLERENERLREENEALAAAGETLRRRTEELNAKSDLFESRYLQTKSTLEEEKNLLLGALGAKDKEHLLLQSRIEELEMRLSTNLKKIRVRERELENRLEIVRMESAAVVRNKDEMILDLKRQIDQMGQELDNYRMKGQELNKKLTDRQELLNRTVRALRLALTLLEGGELTPMPPTKPPAKAPDKKGQDE